jgi:cytochrome c553
MNILRWIGRVLLGLIGLVIVAIAAVYLISNAQLNKTYTIPQESLSLTIPNDQASIERGKHLAVTIAKCTTCHGDNLAGQVFADVPPFRLVAPNLTRGQGGVGGQLTDADWARAIRHGVGPDGKGLLVMPSEDYTGFSDADLAAVIAYAKSVPPVDNQLPGIEVRLLGRVLLVLGQVPAPAAATIDHNVRQPATVAPAVTTEYGHYLAQTGACLGCHGPGLSGGPIPGSPPDFPPAANITPAGIGTWTDQDFFRALREGKRPDGTVINPAMPWMLTREMTDDEIKALLMYLRTVPAKPTGNR